MRRMEGSLYMLLLPEEQQSEIETAVDEEEMTENEEKNTKK
jgi:hypothetical protein